MPRSDQGITRKRYMLIPRLLIFLWRGEEVLLIRGAVDKRLWAGKYNGVGGHVERGEDVLAAARRELYEETGLEADLWLCGTLIVEVGSNVGVGIYVFSGENPAGAESPSTEGILEWVKFSQITQIPTVEDVPILLGYIRKMRRGDPPFAARSFYDKNERMIIKFSQ